MLMWPSASTYWLWRWRPRAQPLLGGDRRPWPAHGVLVVAAAALGYPARRGAAMRGRHLRRLWYSAAAGEAAPAAAAAARGQGSSSWWLWPLFWWRARWGRPWRAQRRLVMTLGTRALVGSLLRRCGLACAGGVALARPPEVWTLDEIMA